MPKDVSTRKCKLCGFPFQAKRFDAMLCSSSCRTRAARVAAGELSPQKARAMARKARDVKARKKVFGKR